MKHIDFSFLTGFNVLTNVLLNHCKDTPSASHPPRNLPTLQKLISILVDGVIYNAQCPNTTILTPCTCSIAAGDSFGTITCPSGTTLEEIQAAFKKIPINSIG